MPCCKNTVRSIRSTKYCTRYVCIFVSYSTYSNRDNFFDFERITYECMPLCWFLLAVTGGSPHTEPAVPFSSWSPLHDSGNHISGTARRLKLRVAALELQMREYGHRIHGFLGTRMQRRSQEGEANHDDVFRAYAIVEDSISSDPSWELKLCNENVRVWRRSVPGSHFAEIRGNGIINSSPQALMDLLCENDADVIRLYNPLYTEGHDVCTIDKRTRLSYATVRAFFPLKPRDTLTRVTHWELPLLGPGACWTCYARQARVECIPHRGEMPFMLLGASALLLRHAVHPAAPKDPNYVRAKILRGMHLVQPVNGSPGKANYTFCTQVRFSNESSLHSPPNSLTICSPTLVHSAGGCRWHHTRFCDEYGHHKGFNSGGIDA